MTMLLILSVGFSTALLALLCLGDPKRLRAARSPGTAQRVATRRWLAIASLLPGIAYALLGDGAGVFLWLGGYAMAGWLVTIAFAAARRRAAQAGDRAQSTGG